MIIHIEDLKFKCIIGILDFERVTPQDIIIDLIIDYDYKKDLFIDYAAVVKMLKDLMIKKRFLLIEDALEEIESELRQRYPSIKKGSIKITKPSILKGCRVSVSNHYEFKS